MQTLDQVKTICGTILKLKHKPKFLEFDRIRMGLSGSVFNQDVSIDDDE